MFFVVNSILNFAQDITVIYYDKNREVQGWKIDAGQYRAQFTNAETGLIMVDDFWMSGYIQMTGSFVFNTEEESKEGLLHI